MTDKLNVTPRSANGTNSRDDQRYRHLFAHMPICLFVYDVEHYPVTILEVNRRVEIVYGYSVAELIGEPATMLVPEANKPAALDILLQAQRGDRVTAEIMNQRRDGTLFPVRVIAMLDPVANGRLLTSVQDITAEKQRRSEAEAIDAERRRIAREIHDGVAQSLAGLRFKSALWAHLANTAPPAIRTALDELEQVLTAAINDLRRAIFTLEPVDLEALGFFQALAQLINNFGDQNQVVARLVITGPQEMLPAAYELPLFRIIQEGLNNISQHAQANSVLIRLMVDSVGSVVVSLSDNGRGFEPQKLRVIEGEGHFGLRQMRERIIERGGMLHVRSAPGVGTELFITLPPLP